MDELIIKLNIEHESAPWCIETPQPEFFWTLCAPERGCRQKAWQMCVSAGETILWDSGKMENEEMTARYAGHPLSTETTMEAHLTVWDTMGRQASCTVEFRTGLMDADPTSRRWHGAKWIGTGTRSLWAPALSVFQFSGEITLEPGACAASLLFGANDPRLMDRDKNILGVEALRFQSYMMLRLNLAPLEKGENALLEIYRIGYTPGDSREIPLYALSIPEAVIHAGNANAPHTVKIKAVYGLVDVFVDGTKINPPPAHPGMFDTGALNLNPMGRGGDYICFPHLCDIGVKVEPGQAATFRNLTVRNYRMPENVLHHSMGDGLRLSGDEQGAFRLFDPSCHGIPMVRGEFSAGRVRRAWLTITARGIYTAYLNGQRVGDDYLAPGLTQYDKTHFYQVYDVTKLLRNGDNALGVALAEGWWSGSISFQGENWNHWGDCQSVRFKLCMEKDDGSIETIVSDPERFTASDQGPVRYASLFQGQVYDAWYEKYTAGWTEPGFTKPWEKAVEIPVSTETAVLGTITTGPLAIRQERSYDHMRLIGQMGGGVKCIQRLPALSVEEVRPGVFVYDFGQNIAGIPEIRLPGNAPGQEVTLRYSEIRYPNLPEYRDRQGMLMTENLRAAHATDVVYLGEKPMVFCPEFTLHGFRYLEITGVEEAPPLSDVRALALSSVEKLTAGYHCSDETVNRLFENICWSLRDNFVSIPTDCPQRNERMGWSGDLSVFSRTAVTLCDADRFLRRHLMAMRDLQQENGMFPDIAPVGGGFGGILWGSAGITVPWEVYRQYGDKAVLEEHYPAMVRYMDYLRQNVSAETGLQTAGELGDWLGPQNGKTENAFLWMAYYAFDLKIMSETARMLGKPEAPEFAAQYADAKSILSRVFFDPESQKTVYSCEDAAYGNRMFFEPIDRNRPLPPKEPGGQYRMDTQTSYAVPLALGVVEKSEKLGKNLRNVCSAPQTDDSGTLRPAYSLMTGFIGTAWILPALSHCGEDETAYGMLLNHSYPSWLYPVDQGAMTIWERLDSYTTEHGFGGHNSMNSFNHYSFGAVGRWLISRSLGITPGKDGFRNFILRPMPDMASRLQSASGWYDSVSGRIESAWKKTSSGWEYRFTVPANTSCSLYLPGEENAAITESDQAPQDAKGVSVIGYQEECHVFGLDAGTYVFAVSL